MSFPSTSGPGRPGPGRSSTSGKGRPTPKRSAAQSRRGGPVAPPPQTRKEAAQRARQEAREAREAVREGRQLMPRDAGPVRALVRDVVDRRRSVGVLMLPLALVLVVSQFVAQSTGALVLFDVAFVLWIVGIVALVVDLVLTAQAIRSRLREEHPEERKLGGHIAYGLMRSTVFRRWRIPAPRVSPKDRRGR